MWEGGVEGGQPQRAKHMTAAGEVTYARAGKQGEAAQRLWAGSLVRLVSWYQSWRAGLAGGGVELAAVRRVCVEGGR